MRFEELSKTRKGRVTGLARREPPERLCPCVPFPPARKNRRWGVPLRQPCSKWTQCTHAAGAGCPSLLRVQPPVQQRGKPGSMPQESPRTKKCIGSLNRLNRMRFSPAACVPSLSRRFRRRGPPPAHSYFKSQPRNICLFSRLCLTLDSPLRMRLSNNGTDSCRCRYALAQNGNFCCFLVAFLRQRYIDTPSLARHTEGSSSRPIGFLWCQRRAGEALVANFPSYLFTCLQFSGSRRGDYEEEYLLGCDAVYSDRSLPTFRRNAIPPPSGCKSNPNKQNVCKLVLN
jgi:hypothetical protein